MNWVTVIWSMISSASLTLAVVHGLVWWRRGNARAHGVFAVSAFGTAVFAGCELWLMRARTPDAYATAMRWAHVPLWLLLVSLVGFIRLYLHAGRRWLAWSIVGMRTLALVVNFLAGQNLNYLEVHSIRAISFLGESVAVPVGVANPWMRFGQSGMLLFLIFAVDATVTVLRRGDVRRAMMVGGSIVFFLVAGTVQADLAIRGTVHMPVTISLCYIGIIIAMSYELSRDLYRAVQLSDDLRESEERLSMTADAANLGLWTQDLVGNTIWTTDKWRALFGFTETEPLELVHILRRLHPDDRDAVSQVLAKALAECGHYEIEHRLLLPDGQVRWVAARGRVECDAEGKAICMRGVSLDITARRKAELQTEELRQGLAHAGRVTMLGQLASSLAHELSQPLGAILRNVEAAELLLHGAPPDLDELRAIVADIHKDDRRAGEVIDRLRSLLKRRTLESRELAVDDLFREVVAMVHSDAARRRVSLSMNVSRELPTIRGDRVHLLQVLLNLILNAMDAVHVEPEERRRVKLHAQLDDGGMVEVGVSDSGEGIAPERFGQLFDPFFTTKPNGMGMGLPISRTIVEAHGGRIWAEHNGGGRGTTFRFTLHAAEMGVAV